MSKTLELMAAIEKYVVGGAVAGLRAVKWVAPDGQPCTDGEVIHLPTPIHPMDDDTAMLWRYAAEHELGHEDVVNSHPHWREVMVEKKKDPRYKGDQLLWWIANLVSDHVQERNRYGVYAGRDLILATGRDLFLGKQLGKATVTPKFEDLLSLGMFVWDTDARRTWNRGLRRFPHLEDDKRVQAMIERIKAAKVCVDDLKNEADVFDAALAIRKQFEDDAPPPPPCESDEPSERGKGEEEGEGEVVEFSPSDAVAGCSVSTHKLPDDKDTKRGRKKPWVAAAEGKGSKFAPRRGVPLSKFAGETPFKNPKWAEELGRITASSTLPASVRRFFMAVSRSKWDTGHRSGRLDAGRLSYVLHGREDIFRRKVEKVTINSAVSLLVDCSGSMNGGNKYTQACAAALMLAESLQGIGVSLEIAGFSEISGDREGNVHDVWLPFGSRFQQNAVVDRMAIMKGYLSNNSDGENIAQAAWRLRQQPEGKKVLIVISDGCPAAHGPAGDSMGVWPYTQEVIDDLEQRSDMMLVGIGIGGHTTDMYKNRFTVERGAPIEDILLDVVRKAVIDNWK